MDNRGNRTALIAVAVGLLSLFLGLCLGAVAGGAGGFILGRQSAPRAQLVPELRDSLPVPRGSVVPPELPEQDLVPPISGALIREVIPETPAAEAGLEEGDVITHVDGAAVDARNPLPAQIRQYDPGDEIELQIWRMGQTRTVTVVLAEHPDVAGQAYLGVNAAQLDLNLEPRVQPNG